MVDYVEDPFGRIVNVHWKDDDEPPDDGEPPNLRCGNFTYTVTAGRPNMIDSVIGNPFEIRDTSNPGYGGGYLPGLFLNSGGIHFGYFNIHETCWIVMNAVRFTVRVTGDISFDPMYYRTLRTVNMDGPKDYNRYPYSLGVPWGPQGSGFLTFNSDFEWDWNANGDKGTWPTYPEPPDGTSIDDPRRWDPGYAGTLWLGTGSGAYGYPDRVDSIPSDFFLGGDLVYAGSMMTVSITGYCGEGLPGQGHGPPLVVLDDGTIQDLADPDRVPGG